MTDLQAVKQVIEKLKNAGKRGYIVGGYSRDLFFKRPYQGYLDLATDATPDEIREILDVKGELGSKYGSLIVEEAGEIFEITTFRKDIGSVNYRRPADVVFTMDLEEDAARRDFAMNAIYYDPIEETFLDPMGGIEDIEKKRMRFIGKAEDRIKEDALRMLRYVRFKNKYNLTVDPAEWKCIKNMLHLLKNLPVERIKSELDFAFSDPSAIGSLKDLKELGFFALLLPEIEDLEKTPGGPKWHLEGNVWIHTVNVLEALMVSGDKTLDLFYACLFHDIGKARTVTFDNEIVHYYDHEDVGAEMFKKIAKTWKFPIKTQEKIEWILRNHLKVGQVKKMHKLKARRLMMHPYFKDLLVVGVADMSGRIPSQKEYMGEVVDFYYAFLSILSRKKFLNGEDVMKKFPELRGVEIGEKLRELNDQILVQDD